MNYEIKFRMWDKKEKRMYEFYQIPDVLKVISDNEFDLYDLLSGGTILSDRFVLMRFTGLKDRDGKEIYEGDILAYPDKRKKTFVIVKWRNVVYCEEYGTYVGFEIPEDYDKMIVIGNIYENPELLEEG